MNKNWTGNKKSVYSTLGSSSHSNQHRQINDYYATDPNCVNDLTDREVFSYNIWECACGEGHISKRLELLGSHYGIKVYSSDKIDRGYGDVIDFLDFEGEWRGDIITNPPYKYALEFVNKSLKIIPKGNKVAMFLKVLFLEGQKRKELFINNPPKIIYVYSKRKECAKNGVFKGISSAVAYGWFVWVKGYKGNTIIKWI